MFFFFLNRNAKLYSTVDGSFTVSLSLFLVLSFHGFSLFVIFVLIHARRYTISCMGQFCVWLYTIITAATSAYYQPFYILFRKVLTFFLLDDNGYDTATAIKKVFFLVHVHFFPSFAYLRCFPFNFSHLIFAFNFENILFEFVGILLCVRKTNSFDHQTATNEIYYTQRVRAKIHIGEKKKREKHQCKRTCLFA